MKLVAPIAALCAFGLLPSDASACECLATRPCRFFLEDCNQQHKMTESQCKMLYDAALKSNGAWGMPEARAANKTRGASFFCFPD